MKFFDKLNFHFIESYTAKQHHLNSNTMAIVFEERNVHLGLLYNSIPKICYNKTILRGKTEMVFFRLMPNNGMWHPVIY